MYLDNLYYTASITKKSWDCLQDKCVVYPEKNIRKKALVESLYVDLFIEKHKEMKQKYHHKIFYLLLMIIMLINIILIGVKQWVLKKR